MIGYPERCSGCGSPLLIEHNDSDREYWSECEDCGNIDEVEQDE